MLKKVKELDKRVNVEVDNLSKKIVPNQKRTHIPKI